MNSSHSSASSVLLGQLARHQITTEMQRLSHSKMPDVGVGARFDPEDLKDLLRITVPEVKQSTQRLRESIKTYAMQPDADAHVAIEAQIKCDEAIDWLTGHGITFTTLDVIRDAIVVVVAQAIGIAPGQFVAVVAIMQLCENLQHANVRLWFGPVGERLLVSPRFHRVHHSVGIGHESHGKKTLGGHNFGVLFPWWDMLFNTADFSDRYDPTGVRDQVEEGRDYGRGYWAQQRLGLVRLFEQRPNA